MDDSPSDLLKQAIAAALSSQWEEAVRLNQLIINVDPKNVDALNRLGRASFELGELAISKKCFTEAVENDPYNQIAVKFLKRIEMFSKKGSKMECRPSHNVVISDLFIEEPGATKIVTLLKVAEPQKLSLLSSGTLINLVVKNRCIAVTDMDGEYLGVLPDDISHHLMRLIKGGNKYQAIIKTVKTNGLSVLIKEVFRSARFKNQPSFLDGLNVSLSYSSDLIIHNDDDSSSYEGEEEEEAI